jgi:ATP-binding cassette subfamily B protein
MPTLGVASFTANLLALALPLAMLQIFDRVLGNQAYQTLTLITIGVVIAIVLENVLRLTTSQLNAWLASRWEHRTSLAALDRLLHSTLQYYFKQEPSVYTGRVSSASKVSSFYSGQALMVLLDLPFVLVFLTLTAFIGGWIVAIPIILLLIFIGITQQFAQWIRTKVHDRHVSDDRRFNFLVEVLTGIHSVKSMGLEPQMRRRHEQLIEAGTNHGEALVRANAIANGLGNLFTQMMVVLVVFFGAYLVVLGEMSTGALAASMMLSIRALLPIRQALTTWIKYQSFLESNHELDEILNAPLDQEGTETLAAITKSLVLDQVVYAPKGKEHPVFDHLSLAVNAGETIAIHGDTGAGKTSLMNLICGLIPTHSGQILLDGTPITHYYGDSIRKQIALLPQSPVTFSGSIIDNLTMFNPKLNQRALALSQELGLDKAVAGMAMGYETQLGKGLSETLPSGIRQMVTIIRALIHEPSVILFDEANIGLDFSADKLLKEYLERQKGKVTIILITPRPSLLSLADRSFVIHQGKLITSDEAKHLPNLQTHTTSQTFPVNEQILGSDNRFEHPLFHNPVPLARCFPPLLEALNWEGSARDLAEAVPHLKHQIDVTDFNNTMSNLGWTPYHVNSKLKSLHKQLTPCLFIRAKHKTPFVLLEKEGKECRIFDPELGEERWISDRNIRGDAYFFKPVTGAEQIDKAKKSNWFVDLLWRFRHHLLLTLALSFVATALSLSAPFFVRSVYDTVIPASDLLFGLFLLFGAVMAIGLEWVVQLLKSRLIAFFGARSEYILNASLFDRIITLPLPAIEGASVDRQIARIRGLEGLREFFLGPIALLMFELPATLVLFAALAFLNPWAIAIVVTSIAIFMLLALLTQKANERSVQNTSQRTGERWEYLNETLTHMQALRLAGDRKVVLETFNGHASKAIIASFEDQKLHNYINTSASIITTLTGLMVLVASTFLVLEQEITAGALMATQMIIWRLTSPLQNAFTSSLSLVRMKSSLNQVVQLMRLPAEQDMGVKQTLQPRLQGAIIFHRVSFRYANDADPALLGVSFNLQPHQMLAISGNNGSGKSSILRMIMRLYTVQAGTIRLDNIDNRQLPIHYLREQIAYMPTNCQVFFGTLKQNLTLIHPSATDAEVDWAIQMAGLKEDIDALPEGLNTRISNARIAQLPNGFLQRFSLARTMLRPAPIILMDEPGSGMDKAGEEALMHCLQWLKGRSTIVIATLRPAHMRLADNIIFMQQGAILKMGNYDEIVSLLMAGNK